ncbi:hypothetical protein [Devosia salina]|uniref:Uncharacterized protein n=1 Tax=Devosia salina TaxID=2860336 RepID=A0ABX8WI98_9HYPH|nr:hypothetical protein [Devosia salina]QYO77746.1 hypothetical protein K1X15_04030 [Devosia salina]
MVSDAIKANLANASEAALVELLKTGGPAGFRKRYPHLATTLARQFASNRSRFTRLWIASGGRHRIPAPAARDAEALVMRLPILLLVRLKLRLYRRHSFWRLHRRRRRKAYVALLASLSRRHNRVR